MSGRVAIIITVLFVAFIGITAYVVMVSDQYGRHAPYVVAIDSVRLERRGGDYLSQPTDITIDPGDGSYIIADAFWNRLFLFGRDGHLQRVFGPGGTGLAQIGPTSVSGPTILAADLSRRVIHRFDKNSGAPKGSHRVEGILSSIVPDGDTIWLGTLNPLRKTGIGIWDIRRDSISYSVPIPDEYRRSHAFSGIFNGVNVIPLGDRLLVGFMGNNTLLLTGRNGALIERRVLPVERRRGFEPRLLPKMDRMPYEAVFRSTSALMRLSRLPTGQFALLHFDQEVKGRSVRTTAYVSLVSADLERACVDARVPLGERSPPTGVFWGDTLILVQPQVRAGAQGETWVRRFLIRDGDCEWISTSRPPAAGRTTAP